MNDTSHARVAVISGASSGIGLATARMLAAQGWRVIAMGRDPGRSQDALLAISSVAAPGAEVDMIRADLSIMAEADRAAREVGQLTDRVDVLINNAGGTSSAIAITSDGNEAVFASNHLAPFLLTARLLPLLERAGQDEAPARIVNVSSSAHEASQGINWDDLQSIGNYVPILAYCNAKLANVMFTRELARRLGRGQLIVTHAIHPGAVDSNFYTYADDGTKEFARTTALISSEQAAEAVVWLATSDEAAQSTGLYRCEREWVTPGALAVDDQSASRLWTTSEGLIARNLSEPDFRFL